MAETLDVKVFSFVLPDIATTGWQGDNINGHMFKAPSDAHGGGITILAAYAVNGAATGAGTGFFLTIQNWGTAGTAIKSSGGTIGASLGGTGDPWAADTPKTFTLTNTFVDAGEWLVARKDETNSSDPTRGVIVIHYVEGR